jgi:hydroxymethylpyrimidine pyrophosphatase-like HAD family hydrolase
MIEAAGCGIAMINGTDLVKRSADVITSLDNDHDGLAEFILKAMD